MSNLINLKFYLNDNQNGGGELADFMPYSDHYKMKEETKLDNPYYCPDLFPFLCKNTSNAAGLCRRTENECNRTLIAGVPNKVRIKYEPVKKSNNLGNAFGYKSDNLSTSCYKWHLIYQKDFDQPERLPDNFKLMTMNIWGLSKKNLVKYSMMERRMNKISEIISNEMPDIVCLQEMSNASFGFLNPQVDTKYNRSEDIFLSDLEILQQRNRSLDCFAYLKYKPKSVKIFSVGGNLGYDNSVLVIEYDDTVIFNIYVQSGSKFSPGQEENAIHYSRCRREQYEMIGRQINEIYSDKKIIICGDFNTHLDGSESDWPETNQLKLMNLNDVYRSLHSDPGLTEDTSTNLMRWNTKFMEKKYRYDGILVKKLNFSSCRVIGKEPFDLTELETGYVLDFLNGHRLDPSRLIYKENSNPRILEWWPSDHYGLVSELSK